jgi:hypothetical protein
MHNFAQFWPQIPIIYDMVGDLGTMSIFFFENYIFKPAIGS